jgi:hypothetical protein
MTFPHFDLIADKRSAGSNVPAASSWMSLEFAPAQRPHRAQQEPAV